MLNNSGDRILPDGGVRQQNAMLTDSHRQHLENNWRGTSRSNKSQQRRVIRERVLHTFLDFTVLEKNLSQEDREQIFDALDANEVLAEQLPEGVELVGDPDEHVRCLTDMLAFVYRETRRGDRHPPFETILENAIVQGENEPGATFYGRYNIDIQVERVDPEDINVTAVAERIREGNIGQLTEGEMAAFLEIMSATDAANPSDVAEEFERLSEQYREEKGGPAPTLGWLLSGGPPTPDEQHEE